MPVISSVLNAIGPSLITAAVTSLGLPGAGVIAGLPRLASLFAGPIDPGQGFSGASAVPQGTRIAELFQLQTNLRVQTAADPRIRAGFTGVPVGQGLSGLPGEGGSLEVPAPKRRPRGIGIASINAAVLGRTEEGRARLETEFAVIPTATPRDPTVGRSVGIGSPSPLLRKARESLLAATQTALSFDPAVAALGEERIAQIMAAPARTVGTPTQGPARFLSGLIDIPALFQKRELDARPAELAEARELAATQSLQNPFFNAVIQAFNAGQLPGAEVSPALRTALGAPRALTGAGVPPRAATRPGGGPTQSAPTAPARSTTMPHLPSGLPHPIDALKTFPSAGGFSGILADLTTTTIPSQTRRSTTMPNVPTGPAAATTGGFGGFLSGLTDVVGALTPLALPFINRAAQPTVNVPQFAPAQFSPVSMPGGAPVGGGIGRPLNVGFPGEGSFAAQPVGLFGALGAATGLGGGACIVPTASAPTMRLPSRVDVPTTDAAGNQRFTTFKNMGRPVLWSGDLATVKRVRRIAGKLGKR